MPFPRSLTTTATPVTKATPKVLVFKKRLVPSFMPQSEVVVDVRLEPARHAGVNLCQAVDRGVVEAHRAVVLVGEILERNSDLELAARGRVVGAHIGDTKCRLFDHRQVREVEPEARQVVAV